MSTRFWLRPKWIFGHVLCAFLVILFVNLGFWQLRRLHERKAHNKVINDHAGAPITTLDDALRGGVSTAQYRRVRITGQWDFSTTVLVRSKSLDEQPGDDVLTTLVVDGKGIVVNRGFAQLGGGGQDAMLQAVKPNTDGTVTVSGYLRAGETRGLFGPTDPKTGHLDVVNRIDLGRLQQQQTQHLVPVYLQLTSSSPAERSFVRPIPIPATNNGPHLSYAIQWFIFATVGAVGWPLLLRKTARSEAAEHDTEADEPV
jgi:surfeit locus 1 family protein